MRRLFLAFMLLVGFVAFSASTAKAQELQNICVNTPIPVGWVLVDDVHDPILCGGAANPIQRNVWIIQRYDNMVRGARMAVCNPIRSGAQGGGLPGGWGVETFFRDTSRCTPNPMSGFENVAIIECLNCPVPTPTPTPVPGPEYEGWFDTANCDVIAGWAWNKRAPNTPLRVDIIVNGALFTQVMADQFRQDLVQAGKGDGRHGFSIPTPPRLKNSLNNTVQVRVTGTNFFMPNGAKSFTCSNPIDNSRFFVRQHYLDFLGREPDPSGWDHWTNTINQCGSDAACTQSLRVQVSLAFFKSIEFKETGYFSYRFYKAAYARMPTFTEFFTDKALVSQGVIVNQGQWELTLETNKSTYTNTFISRPAFQAAYGPLLNHEYVDRLLANAQITDTAFRNDLVNGLNSGQYSRGTVLRKIVDNQGFIQRELNGALVMMQYMGYLRRHPSDPPDGPSMTGYFFWLNSLNTFNNEFEMARAFVESTEYRERFGSDKPFPPPSGGGGGSAQSSGEPQPVPAPPCADNDGDGFCDDTECNPYDPTVYPGAPTYCESGQDRNCNGLDDYQECYGWWYGGGGEYGWW